MKVLKLYPQFSQLMDRRQEDKPVVKDRRSGMDRRVNVDSRLRQDLKQVKDTFKAYVPQNSPDFYKQNVVLEGVLITIPSTRRLVNVEDNKDNNQFKAAGLGLIGLINAKEDLRDLMSILGRSKSEAPDDFYNKYKFFTGTPIEKWLEKSELGRNILYNIDTTLADTKAGDKLYKMFHVERSTNFFSKEINYLFHKPEIINREYIKLEGNFINKLACLTANRITKIGLIAATFLELPSIYKSVKKNKDYSQIQKSGINLLSITFFGALFSATASLIFRKSGMSVIGLGVGSYIGNKLTK